MKKFISTILSAAIIASSIAISPVNYVSAASAALTSAVGDRQLIYATWSGDSNAEGAVVYYKASSDSSYKTVDEQLVRADGNGGRVDIPGLKAGSYDLRIVLADGTVFTRKGITVDADDISGYAHFNYTSGMGAYNDDGTPKSNADIIYVTNDTKNTVQYNSLKGIGNILKNASSLSKPLIVRVIGKIDTQSRDADGTKSTDKANGVVALNGLTDKETDYQSDGRYHDSYFNMLDVKSGKNITVEGIGDDAVIEKWGFTWSDCKSIEVKNLHFTKYPEDACSTQKGERIWFHENTFDVGENKYDLTDEQDKHEGDGSTDIIESKYVTLSYNRYNTCHKTSLHGGGDKVKQYNITWHHNYFNDCSSRMPLVRHANVHTYNNYFYSGTNCIDARASAWVFSEANYFDKCSYAYKTTPSSDYGNPVIKAYNDTLVSSDSEDKTSTIFKAASRTATYDVSANTESYHNFDTDESKFYYDSTNKVSDVSYLTSAEQAKTDCIAYSGVLVSKNDIEGTEDNGDIDISTESTSQTTTEAITENTTETVTETTTEATTANLTPLDAAKYEDATIVSDSSRFVVSGNKKTNGTIKIDGDGYIEFCVNDGANVTVSYSCGSTNAEKSAGLILNGESSPVLSGGNPAPTNDFTVQALSFGTYRITGVQTGGTTVQISAITVTYNTPVTESTTVTTTETTTESTTVTATETTTKTTTVTETENTTEDTTVTETESSTESTTVTETDSSTESTSQTEYEPLYGDADANGIISANDAAMILNKVLDNTFIADLEKKLDNAFEYLDVNSDNTLTAGDAAAVLSKALNNLYIFEAEKKK